MVRKEKITNSLSRAKKTLAGKAVEFCLDAPEAEAAYLAGEFNGWDSLSLPMKKGKDGIWKAKAKLTPGRYEYKMMTGRFWVEDLPGVEKTVNPFGTYNFVVHVE
jgi:1,4-alpha-glucan branching enzyme